MQNVRVGIVGLGFMGRMHLGCYHKIEGAEVVAACARDWSKIENASGGNIAGAEKLELGNARRYASPDQIFADSEIDLVDLCVPTPQHAPLSIAALRAGKHVLLEKPMALSLSECDAILKAQKSSGTSLFVGHCLRFWPQYVRAHELLQNGELGEVYSARFERQSPLPRWSSWLLDTEKSGGAILDLHIHDIDCALWWFGAPAKRSANGVVRGGLPLSVDSSWQSENGVQIQLHGRWDENDSPFRMAFELVGTRGTLQYDSSRGENLVLFRPGEKTEIEVESQSGYFFQLKHIIECLQSGKQSPFISGEIGRESVRWGLETLERLRPSSL